MGTIEDTKMTTVKEGRASFQLPHDSVFYNPVQEFNRDLSIAVLRTFLQNKQEYLGSSCSVCIDNNLFLFKVLCKYIQSCYLLIIKDKVTILEALAASGLRSIRYAKEIEGVDEIIANDISAKAVESMEANIKLNEVSDIVKCNHDDAT